MIFTLTRLKQSKAIITHLIHPPLKKLAAINNECVKAVKDIRLKPHDTTTAEGQSKERLRLLALATITSGIARALGVLVIIISVRIGVKYLDTERFGLWMTITSIITFLNFSDLGLSNSLVNAISQAKGQNDQSAMHKSINSAFTLLTIMACILLCLFFSAYPFMDWASIFNLSKPASIKEAGPSLAIYISTFILSLPLSLAQRVQIGLQQGWLANTWRVLANILAISCVLIVAKQGVSLPILVLAVSGAPTVISAFSFLHYFYFKRYDIRPSFNFSQKQYLKKIIYAGNLFLIIQFMAVLGNASDNFIIAQILGASAVGPFSVIHRLTMFLSIGQLFIAPLWPVFGEALAKNDIKWIKSAFNKSLSISVFIGVLSSLFLFFFSQSVINIWTNSEVYIESSLLLGFCFYSVIMYPIGVLSMLFNNGSLLKPQAIIYSIASLMSILIKIYLILRLHSSSGAIWGMISSYTFFFIFPCLWLMKKRKLI